MVQAAEPYVTYEDYLAAEQANTTKHEWLDGVVYAMAGGSLEHSRLAGNMHTALKTAFAGCEVFQSDAMLFVRASDLSTYADVTLVCGPVDLSPSRDDLGHLTGGVEHSSLACVAAVALIFRPKQDDVRLLRAPPAARRAPLALMRDSSGRATGRAVLARQGCRSGAKMPAALPTPTSSRPHRAWFRSATRAPPSRDR